jgi:hypothetical protein
MILRAYGAQESDCISARFAHIPAGEYRHPSNAARSGRRRTRRVRD